MPHSSEWMSPEKKLSGASLNRPSLSLGGLDVLVQNAGLQRSGLVTEFEASDGTLYLQSIRVRISLVRSTRCRTYARPAKARLSIRRR